MTAHVSCDSETAALNWSKAKGASFYTLLATGSLGYIVDFSTTSTNLSVSLICGQSYSVTVQAHNIYCESQPSTPAVFRLGMYLKLEINLLCTKQKSTSLNTQRQYAISCYYKKENSLQIILLFE